MTVFVHTNGFAPQVVRDLTTIAGPGAGLTADIQVSQIQDIDGGGTILATGTGRIEFTMPPPAVTRVGYTVLRGLHADASVHVRIQGEDGTYRWGLGPNDILNKSGGLGMDWWMGAGAVIMHVYYDVTGCAGAGYWVAGTDGKPIADPVDVILFHELVHDYQGWILNMKRSELTAVTGSPGENEYRTQRGLPKRNAGTSHRDGGCGAPSKAPPKGGCFIATAAYGSPIDPRVRSLRRFRDDVLRKTEAGRAFFDRFYEHYYRYSPSIADAVRADEEFGRSVRVGIVEPVVHFLGSVLDMPDAPLDDVAEPWRSYLVQQRDALEGWAANLDLPCRLRGRPVSDAAVELGTVLRYVWRTPDARRAWLDGLVDAGELPLRGTPRALGDARSILNGYGRPEWEIEAVCGSPSPPDVSRNFGRPDESNAQGDPAKWLYTVTVTNHSEQGPFPFSFDLHVLYKRSDIPNGVVLSLVENIAPTKTAVAVLGPCNLMVSYAFGIFAWIEENGQLVYEFLFSVPADLANEGPITPGSRPDGEPCADSYVLGV
jgi:hypothetical protein